MRIGKTRFWMVLAIAALIDSSVATRNTHASNLDDGYLKGGAAAVIRDHLQKHRYKNVGVLRFEVKKGKSAPSMNVGTMNDSVATRLENALILVMYKTNVVGITRNAGAVAAKRDRDANWHTEAGRARLFEGEYPLAWGDQSVKVDAFLTGTVEISPDYRETKIIVKIFDKENMTLRPIGLPISVKTDRDALREMGRGFVISKRAFNQIASKGAVPDSEVDNIIIEDSLKNPDGDAIASLAKIREYLDFKILVNGVAADIVSVEGRSMIDTLVPGQEVMIEAIAKEKLGLLLRVNGKNTINKEESDRDRMESSWWVLEPGTKYSIRGFYEGGKVFPFEVVAEAEVDKSELGANQERHGIFSFEIFKSVAAGTGEARIVPRKTTKLLSKTNSKLPFASLQANLALSSKKLEKRNVYVVPGKGSAAILETEDFQGIFIGGCDVYYRPK